VAYILTRFVFEETCRVDLTEQEFTAAKRAHRRTVTAMLIEDKFNILIENYAEIERELLSNGLDYMLFNDLDWSSSVEQLHTLNRLVINLLSTSRLYLDHVPHQLNEFFGSASVEAGKFQDATHTEYDGSFSYRMLEELRNYSQHRGLPIHGLGHRSRWNEERTELRHFTLPSLDPRKLEEDDRLKPAVLAELKLLGDSFDLRIAIREYVSSIRRIHGLVREMLAPEIASETSVLNGLVRRFKEECDTENTLGLMAAIVDAQGAVAEQVTIFDEATRRIAFLIRRNDLAGRLEQQVIVNARN
jgi:hypothetical protein